MSDDPKHHLEYEGELVGELLDLEEYPSKIGNVAVVSDRQIVRLKPDKHELTGFSLEYIDIRDCRQIDYQTQVAYYRIVVATALFLVAAYFVYMMTNEVDDFVAKGAPLFLAAIAFTTIGIRFITSIHRHVIRFEMSDGTLLWRSPAIDFKSKAAAAYAVRDFARERGILKEP